MPSPLKFFINGDAEDIASALVTSFTNPQPAFQFSVTQSDTARAVEFHHLKVNLNPNQTGIPAPFVYDDPSGFTDELAIGIYDQPVISGTFTLTDPVASETTGAIAWNAEAATVQTAIRAGMPTNYSAAIVTGNAGGPWLLDRGATGAIASSPLGDTAGISPPDSVTEIIYTQSGTTLINDNWEIELLRPPAILASINGSYLPSAAVSTSSITAGSAGVNAVQGIIWNGDAYAGSVNVSLVLPTGGGIATGTFANPTNLVTNVAHNLRPGDSVTISGNSETGNNATWSVTVIDSVTFSIPRSAAASTGGIAALARTVGPVAFNTTPAAFVATLATHGASSATADSFTVTQNNPGDYSITFAGMLGGLAVPTITATEALLVPVGLKGTANCNTSGVLALLGGNDSIETNLQIKTTVSGVPTVTALQTNTILRKSLSPVGAVSSNPLPPVPTGALPFSSIITGYTGGGAANLDGVLTASISYSVLPVFQSFLASVPGDGYRAFYLKQGTDAPVAGSLIRPTDFDAVTNQKVWVSML